MCYAAFNANLVYFVAERLQQQCAFAHTHPRPCVTRAHTPTQLGRRKCVSAMGSHTATPATHDTHAGERMHTHAGQVHTLGRHTRHTRITRTQTHYVRPGRTHTRKATLAGCTALYALTAINFDSRVDNCRLGWHCGGRFSNTGQ